MMKHTAIFTHRTGFWIIASSFLLTMAYSTVPTPLYLLYQQLDGFATYMITVVFGTYAIGVVVSLYLAGHLSDRLGRKAMVVAATLLEALSAGIFLSSHAVIPLLLARFISGVGIGAMTATATAYLTELWAAAYPNGDRSRSTLLSTVMNTGGLAIGPLVSGTLAQKVPAPLFIPFALFLVLLLVGALLASAVPETVQRRQHEHPSAYRGQHPTAPVRSRGLAAAATGIISGFAVLGMYSSLSPTFVAKTMHEGSLLVVGLISASVFAAATAAQVGLSGAAQRYQLLAGLAATAGGLLLTTIAVDSADLLLFLSAGVVSGAGAGLMLRTSIATASSLAPEDRRGAVLAVIFMMGYLGLALPVIGLGVSLLVLPTATAVVLFASAVLLLVVFSGIRMLDTRRLDRLPGTHRFRRPRAQWSLRWPLLPFLPLFATRRV